MTPGPSRARSWGSRTSWRPWATRKRCSRSRWRPSRWARKPTRRSRRRSPTRRWRPRCGACSGWTKRWSMPSSPIRTFRELGARWELASALGDRGAIHRVAGRLEDAEVDDLREAFVLCRDLKERALVTWTAAELARVLSMQGDTAGARQVLGDPAARLRRGRTRLGDGAAGGGIGAGAGRGRLARPRATRPKPRSRPNGRPGGAERAGGTAVVGGAASSARRPPGARRSWMRPADPRTTPLPPGAAGAGTGR